MDTLPSKKCCACLESKDLGQFGKDQYRPDGKATRCLACKKQEGAAYRAANLLAVREADRLAHQARRDADPGRARRAGQAWFAANPEKVQKYRERDNASKRAKYAENPQPTRDRILARRLADPEKFRKRKNASAQTRRAKNPAMARAKQVLWLANNPDKRRTYERTRRALKANAPVNDLTHAQWLEIQDAQDHRCAYCHKRCKGKLTQDHIVPLSQGGSHTLNNVIGACRSCNSRKGTRKPPIPVQPLLLTIAAARKKKAS